MFVLRSCIFVYCECMRYILWMCVCVYLSILSKTFYVYVLWYIRKSWKPFYYTCNLYLTNNLISYALIQQQFNKVIIESTKLIAKKNLLSKVKTDLPRIMTIWRWLEFDFLCKIYTAIFCHLHNTEELRLKFVF